MKYFFGDVTMSSDDVAPRSDFVDDVAALRLCSVYLDYLLTYHFAP